VGNLRQTTGHELSFSGNTSLLDTITGWLAEPSPKLIYLVPVLAFLESCAGIGLFVSGVFLLSATTVLYTTGSASLTAIVVLGFSGALLGDHSGYLVGRLLGGRVWEMSWLRNREETRSKIQTQLEKSAAMALCFGRLIPLLRSMTPIVAGVSGMSWRKFLACDLLACAIWASGLCLILNYLPQMFL
jgi:membrane-associated protein